MLSINSIRDWTLDSNVTLYVSLLVRRLDGNNQATGLNQAQLDDDVFGDAVCLASRYDECSYGKLTMVKDAIIDLEISEVADGQHYKEVEYGIRNATIDRYGSYYDMYQAVDLVMYCQPPGSHSLDSNGNERDWVAYAFINGFESFYNDVWCGYVTAQVHEIGHNLGLDHSGIVGMSEYEDTSGMMGFSYRSDDGPKICFNAAKAYQLRWYEDKVQSVDPRNLPGGTQSFDLIGVADYGTADGLVSLRLEYEGNDYNFGKEYYVGYNHKAGIHDGVPDTSTAAPDTVHIFEKRNTLASEYNYGKSDRIAALSATEEHSWDIGGVTVTLRVDSIAGSVASVTVFTGDPPPTPLPTLPPTPVPGSPTSSPTRPPTQGPLSSPTPYPTSAGECTSSDSLFGGRPGMVFELEVQLDDKSGSEFGWLLFNELTGAGWASAMNFAFPDGALLRYTFCLPKFECFILQLRDTGEDGICCGNGNGHYKGYIDGEEIFSGGEWTGADHTEEICLGRGEYCEDATRGFKYKRKNRNKKKKSNCEEVSEERGNKRKKICKSTYGDSNRKKVQQLCTESCGKVGLGPCNFLKTYGDDDALAVEDRPVITANGAEASSSATGGTIILVEPDPDNVFSHRF